MKVTDIFDDLLQTGTNSESTVAGILPVKGIEYNDLVCGIFKVSLHHRQFI